MKRRLFVKNSLFAGAALSVPVFLKAAISDNKKSTFLRLDCSNQFPQFIFFSIDSLGKNLLQQNIALKDEITIMQMKYNVVTSHNTTNYFLYEQFENILPVWQLVQHEKTFTVISNYNTADTQPFVFNISQYANHATVLGLIKGDVHITHNLQP